MAKILLWQPVVDLLHEKTKKIIEKHHITWYVAIFMLGENHPWKVYVRKKTEYAEKLWLTTKIFTDATTIQKDIEQCNNDTSCLWIIVQIPLPKELEWQKKIILDSVHPAKDPDCLWTKLLDQSTLYWWHIDIAPATPSAVLHLIHYYHFHHSINWFQIAILWESDLIWWPLAKILATYGWYVHTFNDRSNQKRMREICQESDLIIAATGKLHLVDETFIRPDQSQVVIDVGRGMLDGKPAWDVNYEKVFDKVSAITPVPGGVGPVTVASLFWNIVRLYEQREKITA